MRAETRLDMQPEELFIDLAGAVEAVGKSEGKITDLHALLPEFADVQEIIDRTNNRTPITVAVLGEEITMMGEVIRELEKSYPDYPLADAKGLYCILGIDAFERAVEVAATTGKKLGDLLEEYIAEAAANRPDTPGVDEAWRAPLHSLFFTSRSERGIFMHRIQRFEVCVTHRSLKGEEREETLPVVVKDYSTAKSVAVS